MSNSDQQPATKNDLDKLRKDIKHTITEAIEVILNGVGELLKNYVTKEEFSASINEIKDEQTKMSATLSDVHRRVIDLEHNTPTVKEFEQLKQRTTKL